MVYFTIFKKNLEYAKIKFYYIVGKLENSPRFCVADDVIYNITCILLMIDYDLIFNQILDGYRSNYNVELLTGKGELVATAYMHMSHGQHALSRKFEMWSADEDEYVYFYRTSHLTSDLAKRFIDEAYADGFPKIKLDHVTFNHQHMCTRLVLIVFCDTAEADALKMIKKCRLYKSFQFSLKGWMEMHTAALSLADGTITNNRHARETAKYLKKHVDHYDQHVATKIF